MSPASIPPDRTRPILRSVYSACCMMNLDRFLGGARVAGRTDFNQILPNHSISTPADCRGELSSGTGRAGVALCSDVRGLTVC